MKKIITLFLLLVTLLLISGCKQEENQEIISLNIIGVESIQNDGCVEYNNLNVKFNLQVKNYNEPIPCRMYDNGKDIHNEMAFNGLNSWYIVVDSKHFSRNDLMLICGGGTPRETGDYPYYCDR